jgi:iron(III) transport system permease protein
VTTLQRTPSRSGAWDPIAVLQALGVLFLAAFILVPLGVMLTDTAVVLVRGGARDLPEFSDYVRRLTIHSVGLAASVTLVCLLLGAPLAFFTERALPRAGAWRVMFTLPMLSPPFVSAFATVLLFGRVGVVTQLLASVGARLPDLYGFYGIHITHVLHLTPLAYLTIAGGLRTVPKAIEESALSLGGTHADVVRRVVLPYVRPYIYMAALLTFLVSFGDVGAPLIVGGNFLVLPAEAFTRFLSFAVDRRVPLLLGSWIIVVSMALLLLVRALMRRTEVAHTFTPETYAYASPALRRFATAFCAAAAVALLLPFAAILIVSLTPYWGASLLPRTYTADHYAQLWRSGEPLRNSLLLSAVAMPVALASALFLTRLVRRGGRVAAAVDYASLLPFVTSGVVLAIGIVRVYGPLEAAGLVAPAVMAPGLLVTVLVSRRISYPIRVLNAAWTRVDRRLEECSLTLGASPARTFARVLLPQLVPAIAAAGIITFVQVFKELGATLIVQRPGWQTLPVQVYQYAVDGQLGRAGAVSMVMLAVVGALTYAAQWRPRRRADA